MAPYHGGDFEVRLHKLAMPLSWAQQLRDQAPWHRKGCLVSLHAWAPEERWPAVALDLMFAALLFRVG